MMEMIVRLNSDEYDAEIAIAEQGKTPMFKKIKREEFVQIVNDNFTDHNIHYKKDIKLLDSQIIGIDEHHVVIKQEEHKKIITYSYGDELFTYKINFPNALYIVEKNDNKITAIECYAYKEFENEDTALFEYPMPNELSRNNMCIGNADRTIENGNILEALERIIFTPYSHATFSGMNGFSQTKPYFEYLEKNEFPYKLMKPLKKKLKEVLKG